MDEDPFVDDLRETWPLYSTFSGGGSMFYDRAGNPIDMGRWIDLDRDWNYKCVRLTELHEQDARISTVWLGLDHGIFGPPLIFETMISTFTLYPSTFFGRVYLGPAWEDLQWRYATETEAIQGHTELVRLLERAAHDLDRLGKEIVLREP